MPVGLLNLSPLYCIVGIYRLVTNPQVRIPIWKLCRKGLFKGGLLAILFSITSWPIQSKIVSTFMRNSPKVLQYSTQAIDNHIPLLKFATLMFVSAQATTILEFFLYKEVRQSKKIAYDLTIASREKKEDFWGPYVEQFDLNTDNGRKLMIRAEELSHSRKRGWRGLFEGQKRSQILSIVVTKCNCRLPLDVLPGVGLILGAALRSVALARRLLKPYFARKEMTPYEQELFIQERSFELRSFGFVAALLERLPFGIGTVCSISTPIAAAMMSVDYEKVQNEYRNNKTAKQPYKPATKIYSDANIPGSL